MTDTVDTQQEQSAPENRDRRTTEGKPLLGTKDNSSFLEEVGHEPILDGLVYSSELDIDLEGDILVVSRFSTSCFLYMVEIKASQL